MSETHDPWKDVERWDVAGTYVERMRVKFAGHPNGGWMRSTDIDTARAAVEARHQQEIAALKAIVADTLWMAGRYADGRRSYAVGLYNDARGKAEALGCANDAKVAIYGHDAERPTLVEQNATITAERDNQYAQAVEATQRALLAEQALANVEAERDRLKAALELAWKEIVQSGNDTASDYGWPAVRKAVRAALSGEGTNP